MLVLLERRGGRSDSDKEVALTCTVYNLPLPRWQERPSRWQLVFGSCKTREREREREERRERGKRKKLVGVFSYSGRVPFLPLLALFQLFSLPAALSYLFHQLILRFTHFVSLSLRSHFQKISSLLLSFSASFFFLLLFFFFFFFFFSDSLIFSTDFPFQRGWLLESVRLSLK